MEVDSLVVSLGLDPRDFRAALNQVLAVLRNLDQGLRDFAQGFAEGCEDALNEARQSANSAAQEAGHAAREGQRMGQAFRQAGETGSQGVNRLANTASRAAQRAKDAGNSMRNLGRQWGSFLQGLVTRFAAPMAGALSVGAMVGTYLSGVSQVAQMYGRWTPQMEEWRKKQELLSRVNREDIELYRKGKLALMDFQFAMAGLSTTIMRALSPAIRAGIELLHQVADWVRRNEPNIIRFVTVLAGTITAVLLPAFVKLGVAMLANPLTWIIGGIVALAIVIDDLVVYIRHGISEFDDFWAIFGTGEEIAESLGAAWEWLKETGTAVWETLSSSAKTFFGFFEGAIEPLEQILTGFIGSIKALFSGSWKEAGQELRKVFDGVAKFFKELWDGIIKAVKVAIQKILDMLPSWEGIKSGASSLLEGGKEFFGGLFGDSEEPQESTSKRDRLEAALPLGARAGIEMRREKEPVTAYDYARSGFAAGRGAAIPSYAQRQNPIPPSTALTALAVPPSVSNTNSKSVDVSNQTSIGAINVVTQATDAAGIARDMVSALEQNPLIPGVNAADGGVF